MKGRKKYVSDTSCIIDGKITELIKENKIKGELIIPEFVISELENQANRGREIGFCGLEELKRIRALTKKKKIKLSSLGRKPTSEEIQLAKSGRIDALIRDIAKEQKATLITSDMVQAKVAEAENVSVIYFKREKIKTLKIEKYFDKCTMSVHLKENVKPKAKRGKPGAFKLIDIGEKVLTKELLEEISKEIMDAVRLSADGFIEIGEYGATVVQLGQYRIAITRRPFSERMEITAVRPIIKMKLEDYKLSKKLKERLEGKAEGILIAGPPGSGKTSLGGALAEFYQNKGKIVKTLENPRDLQVGPEITQYGALDRDMSKTADILLLVRPDFSIYDELRKSSDFKIFSDLRLAGIGLIGITHASETIDAIQRFIGRVDLGMIPHIVDTIVYVKDGEIKKVYSLSLTVRVPHGMSEADLARPIVDVSDFETGKLEYEIYTYGEQTVVIPIKEEKKSAVEKLALEKIKTEIAKFDTHAKIEFINANKISVRVRNDAIPYIIGKEGKTIKNLEDRLGISIDIEPAVESLGNEIDHHVSDTGGYIIFEFKNATGKNINIYVDDEYLFTATVGRSDQIRVNKKSDLGRQIIKALTRNSTIKTFV